MCPFLSSFFPFFFIIYIPFLCVTSTCSIHLALWPKLADALFYANFNQERFAWNHCRSCCTWFYFLINSSTLCFDSSPSHLYSLKLEYVLLILHNSYQFIIFCPFRIAILVYAAPISINIHDIYKTISRLRPRLERLPRTPARTVELHAKCIQVHSAVVIFQSGEKLKMSEAVVQAGARLDPCGKWMETGIS